MVGMDLTAVRLAERSPALQTFPSLPEQVLQKQPSETGLYSPSFHFLLKALCWRGNKQLRKYTRLLNSGFLSSLEPEPFHISSPPAGYTAATRHPHLH
jgi:hypothetical protein